MRHRLWVNFALFPYILRFLSFWLLWLCVLSISGQYRLWAANGCLDAPTGNKIHSPMHQGLTEHTYWTLFVQQDVLLYDSCTLSYSTLPHLMLYAKTPKGDFEPDQGIHQSAQNVGYLKISCFGVFKAKWF